MIVKLGWEQTPVGRYSEEGKKDITLLQQQRPKKAARLCQLSKAPSVSV